jgi:hypothetical protein
MEPIVTRPLGPNDSALLGGDRLRVDDDHLIHDVETCSLCLPGLERLAEAVERIRAHHDRTLGHTPTNRVGYCAEPDGISATYCETGILLAALR